MDGATGLIRVAFDFSVWPIDGHNQNSAGSSNIFTSADACQGSTCIPWFENMSAEDVITAVVSHVLYNVAKTSNQDEENAGVIKLRKEWSRVLRLALVVDHSKGGAASNIGSNNHLNLMSPAKKLLHTTSLTETLRNANHPSSGSNKTNSSSSSTIPLPVSSLVVVNPTVPLQQQQNVIQSLTTSGSIKTLETAIVVLPYDDEAHKKAAAKQEAQETKRRKEMIVQASSEDLERKFQVARNRDEQVRRHSDSLRSAFNSHVLMGQDLADIAELVEKQKAARAKKEKLIAAVDAKEQEWRSDLVTVEQSLSRLVSRIDLFQREKEEIEQMIYDLHHSSNNNNNNTSFSSHNNNNETSYGNSPARDFSYYHY